MFHNVFLNVIYATSILYDYNLIDSLALIQWRYYRSYQHNEPKTAPGRRTVFVKEKKSASKYRLKDCQYLVFSFTLYPSVDGSLNGNVTFRRKKRERDRRRAESSLFFPSVVSLLPPATAFLPYRSPYPVVLSLLSRLIIRSSSRVITCRLQIIRGPDSNLFFKKGIVT